MPDVQWQVGEGAERETIAKSPSARRSRRGWMALVIVVILGAALGAWYRSLPEPAPRPTSTPPPTPQPSPARPALPARLYAAIDQEAQALADGDVEAFLALHVYEDEFWTKQLRDTFQAWERPPKGQPLFSIIDFQLRTSAYAWADIRQFRNGRSFRETRFYVWDNDRWLRDDPDPFFWNGQTETLDTSHLHVIYAIEDRALVRGVTDQMEELFTSICADLDCVAMTPPFTHTLNMNYYQQVGDSLSEDGQTSAMLSPRVTGIYEDAQPYYLPSDDLAFSISRIIAWRMAYGHTVNAGTFPNGLIIVLAIANWGGNRVNHQTTLDELQLNWNKPNLQPAQTLESLWELGVDDDWPAAHTKALAVVYFIEQEYGAQSMPKLLKALGTAQSFADMLETGLGIPFAEFDQKWQAWLQQNLAEPR